MSLLDKARQHKAEQGQGQTSDFTIGTKDDNPGDAYEGKVTAVRSVTTKYGDKTVVDIELADGKTLTALGFRAGLADEIKRANPKVGDMAAVWFEGPVKTKSGNFFNRYAFVTEAEVTGAETDELPF